LCAHGDETTDINPAGKVAMLIRFRVENFRSIKDEQELSLVA
jgi:hypothetical protein